MEKKYYVCEHCGNIVTKLNDSGVPLMCCGQKMKELEAGVTDAALEKHVPVARPEGDKVYVEIGAAIHPMVAEHYIQWIALHTEKGVQIKYLKPEEEPKAVFTVEEGDKAVAVYEYCNLHGLWKAEL